MHNRKAIALNGITFYHTQGHSVVTEGCALTFYTYAQMEQYIQDRKGYWSELLNLELVMSPDNNETLMEKDVLQVLKLVCRYMDVDFDSACSRYRGGDEVKARRLAMGICHRRNVQKITIAKVMNVHHTNITYHIKTLTDLCDVDASYRKVFLDTEDYVLGEIGGRFNENGSGEPLK